MNCTDKMILNNDLRMLWFQHGEWMQNTFMQVIFDNPDEEMVIRKLLQKPESFAKFLKSFYGDEMAYQFGKLLTEHISLAVAWVELKIIEDVKEADKINKRLYENADRVAKLLASMNPFWHLKSWRNVFYGYIDLAKAMAEERINGEYEKSMKIYDEFQSEIMVMANMMAEGMIRQFFQSDCC